MPRSLPGGRHVPKRPTGETIAGLLKTYLRAATEQLDRALGAFGLCGQCRHHRLRRRVRGLVQGRDAQPPLGPGALWRGQHRAWAAWCATSSASRPGPSPTPTCSALARPTCLPTRCPAARSIRGASPQGVVAGIEDYGNKMGIPTVNGAILYDPGYTANPLVYCGCVGIAPKGIHRRDARPGDLCVAVGGRTGRDGLHGATFSSAELTHETGADRRQRGADRQPDHRKDRAGGDHGRPRRGPLHGHHRLRRGRLFLGGGRDGQPGRRRGRPDRMSGSSTPACGPGRSGSQRRRSAWCWPCRPSTWRGCRRSATASTSSGPSSAVSPAMGGCACATAARSSADLDMEFLHDGRPPRHDAGGLGATALMARTGALDANAGSDPTCC